MGVPLASLDVSGDVTDVSEFQFNPSLTIETTGAQAYAETMNIAGSNTVFTGSTVTFGGAIDGFDQPWDLTVNGNASFGGDVGDPVFGLFALNSLNVTGTTAMNPGLSQINTVNGQTFGGTVTLGTAPCSMCQRSPSTARLSTSTNPTI